VTGNLTAASSLFHKVLVFFQAQPNNPLPVVDAQVKLGYVAQQQGNAGEATRYLMEGLALARQLGYKRRIAAALMGLGGSPAARGRRPVLCSCLAQQRHCANSSVPHTNLMSTRSINATLQPHKLSLAKLPLNKHGPKDGRCQLNRRLPTPSTFAEKHSGALR